jgi:hypothetical protein
MEILPNVYLVPGVTANPFLIVDPDGVTLVDACLPGSEKKILRALAELGKVPAELKRILITHADFEHVGGLAALKTATGARVYASAVEAEAMAAGHSSRLLVTDNPLIKFFFWLTSHLVKPKPVTADELLTDGQDLPVLGGLRVVETIGHTPRARLVFCPLCRDPVRRRLAGLRADRPARLARGQQLGPGQGKRGRAQTGRPGSAHRLPGTRAGSNRRYREIPAGLTYSIFNE